MEIKLGDRVLACVGGAGYLRPGVVTGVVTAAHQTFRTQYFVHFDGDHGHSGPCLYPIKEKS